MRLFWQSSGTTECVAIATNIPTQIIKRIELTLQSVGREGLLLLYICIDKGSRLQVFPFYLWCHLPWRLPYVYIVVPENKVLLAPWSKKQRTAAALGTEKQVTHISCDFTSQCKWMKTRVTKKNKSIVNAPSKGKKYTRVIPERIF